jgi:hypothetical protein
MILGPLGEFSHEVQRPLPKVLKIGIEAPEHGKQLKIELNSVGR